MMRASMLSAPPKAYLLFGGVEPWADGTACRRAEALRAANSWWPPRRSPTTAEVGRPCVAAHRHLRRDLRHVREPGGPWQSFAGAAQPLGQSRPGWKVLRVLGNLAGVADFEYQSSEEVREELRTLCGGIVAASYQGTHEVKAARPMRECRRADVPGGCVAASCTVTAADRAKASGRGRVWRRPGRMSWLDTGTGFPGRESACVRDFDASGSWC